MKLLLEESISNQVECDDKQMVLKNSSFQIGARDVGISEPNHFKNQYKSTDYIVLREQYAILLDSVPKTHYSPPSRKGNKSLRVIVNEG